MDRRRRHLRCVGLRRSTRRSHNFGTQERIERYISGGGYQAEFRTVVARAEAYTW